MRNSPYGTSADDADIPMGVLQQVGAGAGGGAYGVNRVPGGSGYNPAVAGAANDLAQYRQAFGHNWLKANSGSSAADFQAALTADPTYQSLLKAQRGVQQAHVEGTSQPQYDQMQAAIAYLNNRANAVTTDAQTRRVSALGEASRDTGQGDLYRSQAANTTALTPSQIAKQQAEANAAQANAYRTTTLTPAEVALQNAQAMAATAGANRTVALTPGEVAQQNAQAAATNAQAQATTAGANRTAALTPAEVAQGNANAQKTQAETAGVQMETKLRPQILQAAQAMNAQDRQLERDKTQSEIVKNLRDPITGEVSPLQPPPAAAPGGAAPAATGTPAPTSRGVFRKALDALWGGIDRGAILTPRGSWLNALNPLVPAYNGISGAIEGWNGPLPPAPSAPAAAAPAVQRRQLPDGRLVEISPDGTVNQILPDGTRRQLRVTQ